MSDPATTQGPPASAPPEKKDRTHYLYIAVIAAVVLGVIVGLVAPDVGKALKPLGTGFVNLIKMMISPVIFCTIVLGVGSIRQAAKVGKVGGLALGLLHRDVDGRPDHRAGRRQHPAARCRPAAQRRRTGRGREGGQRRGRDHDRVPARHHPDHAGLPADRRDRAADAVRRAAHRLRRAGASAPPGRRSCAASSISSGWSSRSWS